jgi:hypothetical protein
MLKNERFQSEYRSWRIKVDSMSDCNQKTELLELLNKLVNEVKKLDTFHEELVRSHSLPMGLDESKSRIAEIRKKIQKRINDIRE